MGADGISISEFGTHLDFYLNDIQESLTSRRFKIAPLHHFLKPKEAGKFRLITVFDVKDRVVIKASFSLFLNMLFDYIDTKVSYCGVTKNVWGNKNKKDLNTKKAFQRIIQHVKSGKFYVFKSDIKRFYDNVPKRKLYNIFVKITRDLVGDESLNFIVKQVIYFRLKHPEELTGKFQEYHPNKYRGICQGSGISQLLANIYLADFDKKMYKIYGNQYIRYVDDFIIFCNTKEGAQSARLNALKFIKKEGLELSKDPEKTNISNIKQNYVNFLGIRIDGIGLRYKKNRGEVQKKIKDILDHKNHKLYKDCKNKQAVVTSMNSMIKGLGEYLRYYHTYDTYNEINKWIKLKHKRKGYSQIQLLDVNKIQPIIVQGVWQSWFK